MSIYYLLLHFQVIKEYYEKVDVLKKYGIYAMLFLGCLVAPFIEESMFRWHLRKKYATIYFICFSLAIISAYFLNSNYLYFPIFTFFLIIALILHSYFKRISTTRKQLFWRKAYPFIFYYSGVLFGLVHYTNMKDLTLDNPVFLIFVSSQAFGGLSMGYLRIKYGFWYSVLFHCCFNFIAIMLEFFLSKI
ncbi:CPBP family glutamic-type intramembrane protease [Pedobacter frigidisoli]|nr:CPBP family glutamic-type intramembrane protease [Pedobacter frigidisoli]